MFWCFTEKHTVLTKFFVVPWLKSAEVYDDSDSLHTNVGTALLGLVKSQVCAIFRIVHGYKRKLHALIKVSDEFGPQRAVRSTIIRQWIYCLCHSIRTPLFVSLADLPALWSIE